MPHRDEVSVVASAFPPIIVSSFVGSYLSIFNFLSPNANAMAGVAPVEVLETGIKVVEPPAPYARGGKIGLFEGAGWKGSVDSGAYQHCCKASRSSMVCYRMPLSPNL
jgi:hypothetical protein